ncbi:hypothetical protein SLE2022_241580 [Rubroshorea leprosula]
MDPKGTIVFSTVGRSNYGFDVFSVQLNHITTATEHRLTDGISINFNAQFIDEGQSIVFVSERSGSPQIYLTRPSLPKPEPLASVPQSLFHDRPILKNNRLYFVSAHEQPDRRFQSWSALYSTEIGDKDNKITRLTPYGAVDYSPAVSKSGKFVAVASYGSRGWPTWSCDSSIYFHRQADDGWWSVFRVDFPENPHEFSGFPIAPLRVTPPGLHCFTPAAFHDGKRLAVATRRRDKNYRHIEIFDLESKVFYRGESTQGETTIPHLELIKSPIRDIRLLRINGNFPSFSPDGHLIAFNTYLDLNGGVKIIKSDGSKRWTLIKHRTAFHNSWSPAEKNVIYTSLGPIFQSPKMTVQIARVVFDLSDLNGDREEIPCDVKILTREDSGNNAFPSCSPDGKSVVFRSGRSGYKNLYILDAVNGEFDGGIRQLTNGPWIDTMPSWSPKGDLIAFSSNMHNPDNPAIFSIYVIKPDGSELRRIPVAGAEGSSEVDRERINHVCFSSDGEWLLFTANFGGVTAEPVSWPNQFQPYGDLFVVRLDGSGLRRLTCNGYEHGTPAWHSGGELDMGRVCLELNAEVGEKLKGEFEEPRWITCDF